MQCCGQIGYNETENEESIGGFKKGNENSDQSKDEMLPLPPELVTSKVDLLLETKSVLQDEKYFNILLMV